MTAIPNEAIEAAVGYLPGIPTDNRERQLRRRTAEAMLTAAAPLIEAQVREQVAGEVGQAGGVIYPDDIFPPLSADDWPKIEAALHMFGYTLDRVAAALIRRGFRIAAKEIKDGTDDH